MPRPQPIVVPHAPVQNMKSFEGHVDLKQIFQAIKDIQEWQKGKKMQEALANVPTQDVLQQGGIKDVPQDVGGLLSNFLSPQQQVSEQFETTAQKAAPTLYKQQEFVPSETRPRPTTNILDDILRIGGQYGDTNLIKTAVDAIKQLTVAPPKETGSKGGLGGIVDLFGMSKFGDNYKTPEGQAMLAELLNTEEGQSEFLDYANKVRNASSVTGFGEPMKDANGQTWVFRRKAGKGEWLNINTQEVSSEAPAGLADVKTKSLSPDVVQSLAGFQTVKGTLSNISERMKGMASQIGQAEGRAAKLNSALFGDKEFQKLKGDLFMLIEVLYAKSGKVVPADERKVWFENVLPAVDNPDVNVEAKLDLIDDYVSRNYNNVLGEFGKANYNVSQFKPLKKGSYSFEGQKGTKIKTADDFLKSKGHKK